MQSFAEKLTGLMARPNQPDPSTDPAPWYMKYGGRALGIVGAFCKWKIICSKKKKNSQA